jgi:hypothetical protein
MPADEFDVHEKDRAIFEKRIQWSDPERAASEIKYERHLVENFGIYHIKTNDKLSEIAARFDLDEDRLAFVNNLFDKNILYFGSCLRTREYKND